MDMSVNQDSDQVKHFLDEMENMQTHLATWHQRNVLEFDTAITNLQSQLNEETARRREIERLFRTEQRKCEKLRLKNSIYELDISRLESLLWNEREKHLSTMEMFRPFNDKLASIESLSLNVEEALTVCLLRVNTSPWNGHPSRHETSSWSPAGSSKLLKASGPQEERQEEEAKLSVPTVQTEEETNIAGDGGCYRHDVEDSEVKAVPPILVSSPRGMHKKNLVNSPLMSPSARTRTKRVTLGETYTRIFDSVGACCDETAQSPDKQRFIKMSDLKMAPEELRSDRCHAGLVLVSG
eukprot:746005-Hanusia_phi.AAC.1